MDFNQKLGTIINGDSIVELDTIPDESVHLILSDIPYGIGVDDWDVLHNNTNSAILATVRRRKKPVPYSRKEVNH